MSQEAVDILGSSNDDHSDDNNDQAQEKMVMGKEISELSGKILDNGRILWQLPIKLREVSTLEARTTMLMIQDVIIEERIWQQLSSRSSNIESLLLLLYMSSISTLLSIEQNCYDILLKYLLISDTASSKIQLGVPRRKIKNTWY